MWYWIWIIFHIIVDHDQTMCHDIDPRSYLIFLNTHSFYCNSGSGHFTQLLTNTKGCVVFLTHDHFYKLKVGEHMYHKFLCRSYLFNRRYDLDDTIIYTIVNQRPRDAWVLCSKVKSIKSRNKTHINSHNPCPGDNIVQASCIAMIVSMIFVYNQSVCNFMTLTRGLTKIKMSVHT